MVVQKIWMQNAQFLKKSVKWRQQLSMRGLDLTDLRCIELVLPSCCCFLHSQANTLYWSKTSLKNFVE